MKKLLLTLLLFATAFSCIAQKAKNVTVSTPDEFIKQAAKENPSISVDLSLAAAMDKAEKEILEQALDNYKSTRAIAKVLQVSQPTIVRKLNKYGLARQSE